MNIHFYLEKNDHLIYQLYVASKSERIRKKRLRSKILWPVIYGIMSLFFFGKSALGLGVIFIILSALWFVLYPIWERRYYVKHYQGFIDEHFTAKDQIQSEISLEFDEKYLFSKDYVGESKIILSEIQEIVELESLILMRLSDAISIILPKERIQNIDEVKNYLNTLAERLNISYHQEQDWQWK